LRRGSKSEGKAYAFRFQAWRGNDESVSQKILIDEVDEFFGLALSNLTFCFEWVYTIIQNLLQICRCYDII